MPNKIQVSTIAKPREPYTSNFTENANKKDEWIPKKPSVHKTLRFSNESVNPSDYYAPIYKRYTQDEVFIAPQDGCVAFVLVVGGHGYGTHTKGFAGARSVPFTNPVGGWQIRTNATHGTGNGVNYKFEAHNKTSTQNDYYHNPPANAVVSPSSFGQYLSANGGASIEKDTLTNKQIYRQWLCTGWDGWWALGDRFQRSYWANETQNVKLSSGNYDGDLCGNSSTPRFGVFTLAPNEVVPLTIGTGERNGYIDLVYFRLHNGNNEVISKPSRPNDVTAGIALPTPPKPQPPTPIQPQPTPQTQLFLSPNPLILEKDSIKGIQIVSDADNLEYHIAHDTIAQFDETSKEIRGLDIGITLLSVTATKQDCKDNTQGIQIQVIAKQVPNTPNQPQPPQTAPLLKAIYTKELSTNLDSMSIEELSYSYSLALAYSKMIAPAQNNNDIVLIHTPLSKEVKQELQDIYALYKDNNAMRDTLKHYALALYSALAQHISTYHLLQGHDPQHIVTLEALIEEHEQSENGEDYTHRFKDDIVNMDTDVFLNNIVVWIRELDGLIVRG